MSLGLWERHTDMMKAQQPHSTLISSTKRYFFCSRFLLFGDLAMAGA